MAVESMVAGVGTKNRLNYFDKHGIARLWCHWLLRQPIALWSLIQSIYHNVFGIIS